VVLEGDKRMAMEQLLALIEELGLIDLGDAVTYLDEEGALEACSSLKNRKKSITMKTIKHGDNLIHYLHGFRQLLPGARKRMVSP